MQAQKEAAPIAAGRAPEVVPPGTGDTQDNTQNDSRFQDASYLEQIETDIETAYDYERVLARKQYRVRKMILDLKIKRDHLHDLGRAMGGVSIAV